MFSFILNDPASTFVVVGAIIIVIILYFLGMKKKATRLALELIDIAEELLGPQKGNEKHWYVVDKLYPVLPKLIKRIYKKEDFSLFVEKIFVQSKYFLKNITEKV